jgi:hypothetical protein
MERVLAFTAALLLFGEVDYSDPLGFALALFVVFWQWRKRPAMAPAPIAVKAEPAVKPSV